VVSVERRFTHGGILAALIDLAADWAPVGAGGEVGPTPVAHSRGSFRGRSGRRKFKPPRQLLTQT
jgi:hypothetical protein